MNSIQFKEEIYIFFWTRDFDPRATFFFKKNGERQKGGSTPPSELSVTTHLSYQHENQKQLQLFLESVINLIDSCENSN